MAAPSKKRCKQGSLDGFFKKQRIDSDAGNYKLKCLNHCHNIIKSSKKGSFISKNCWKYEKNSTQKWSFNNEIKCQERPRMQDFAPFIPELLGALSGPQTPGRKGRRASPARQKDMLSASICLLLFNFLLLLQNLLTSLQV